jgi:hypothetical protein
VALDIALLDGIGRILLDDRKELLDTHLGCLLTNGGRASAGEKSGAGRNRYSFGNLSRGDRNLEGGSDFDGEGIFCLVCFDLKQRAEAARGSSCQTRLPAERQTVA